MSLNPDPSKQPQEIHFSRKIRNPNHPVLISNTKQANETHWYQKHLGMFLDNKLNFREHLK